MPRVVEVDDVLVLAVPEQIDPNTNRDLLRQLLNQQADETVGRQYRQPGKTIPTMVMLDPPEWLITRDPTELDRFQPVHSCARCLAGQDQAKAFLREHPGRWVAAANLHYQEVW